MFCGSFSLVALQYVTVVFPSHSHFLYICIPKCSVIINNYYITYKNPILLVQSCSFDVTCFVMYTSLYFSHYILAIKFKQLCGNIIIIIIIIIIIMIIIIIIIIIISNTIVIYNIIIILIICVVIKALNNKHLLTIQALHMM